MDNPHLLQALAASFITRSQIIGQIDRVDKVIDAVLSQWRYCRTKQSSLENVLNQRNVLSTAERLSLRGTVEARG